MEGKYVTKAGQSSDMFGWSWTEVIVLGSQVFGQALIAVAFREDETGKVCDPTSEVMRHTV